ncbi:hypothetical protein ACFV5N_06705 [Streptomyces sp. NPDC059853]|uniref:hypothetical protein n=1 Tax=Streptomyces sp. NPDC059853 TaxID=3346973 RepID=UPI0036601A41
MLAGPARPLDAAPFFMGCIAGTEESLAGRGCSPLLRIVRHRGEETATHRRWVARGRVEAVALVDATTTDGRPAVLREPGMPTAAPGGAFHAPGHHRARQSVKSCRPGARSPAAELPAK